MPELRQESLHQNRLPLGYLPLVRHLDRFISDSLQLRPRKDEADDDEIGALRQQHDELMAEALTFFRESGGMSDLPASKWAVALGLYRCTFYEETVLGEPSLVDTCGSLTLRDFAVDTAQGPAARAALAEWLDADLDALARTVQPELDSLAFRHALMAALETRHPLGDGGASDEAVLALFGELYPGHPFEAGEVQIIRTATGIFFCLRFEGLAMVTPQWAKRGAAQRTEVEAFLRRWSKFKQRYYAHFPAFGFFRGDQAAPELLHHLAEATNRNVAEVADALTTMVTILQASEVDKYIVHDAWGHQWQSLLFRFEETYRAVAGYDKLPELTWQPPGLDASLKSLVERGVQDGVNEAIAEFDAYLRATVEKRLLHSLAGLVAEVLADVVEYKFILLHPEQAEELLSSSFFKDLPTKLDLTLWDLPWYFKIALRGFEQLVEKEAVRDEVAAAFPQLDHHAVREVIDAFAQRASELLDFDFRRSLHYEVEADELVVNAFCRVALNFLAMQAVFNDVYDRLRREPAPTRPEIDRFHDVLVFATASFFELDWREHFWLVDEFLSHFVELWPAIRDRS